MKKQSIFIPAAAAVSVWAGCFLWSGCSPMPSESQIQQQPQDENVLPAMAVEEMQNSAALSLAESSIGVMLAAAPKRHGSGRLTEVQSSRQEEDDPPSPLTLEQQALITGYMDRYFESLSTLKLIAPSPLFADPQGLQAAGNRAVWEYLVELRRMQPQDLSLTHYQYMLSCRQGGWGRREEPLEEEDGKLRVMAVERSVQNFSHCPQTDAESAAVYHQFVLVQTPQGWKIESHMQMDTLYVVLFLEGDSHNMREYLQGSFPEEKGKEYIDQRLETLLREARQEIEARSNPNHQDQESPSATAPPDHPYDRESAVAYALEWVGKRNEEWADYGIYGGNCQNYVSQCLLAGGIPMDPYGDSLWKWYSDVPHNRPGAVGRSASWSGVEEFRSYAEDNTGYGMAAQANAPYYSGEAGDVLDLGTADSPLRHAVIITQVVRDKEGNTIDYLVSSNTSDLKNFPASAYFYTTQSLVKILGWND